MTFRTSTLAFLSLVVLICPSEHSDDFSSSSTTFSPSTVASIDTASSGTLETFTISPNRLTLPDLSKLCENVSLDLSGDRKEYLDTFFSQIVVVLKHLRNPEAVGFPGQTILKDPLAIRNTTGNLAGFVTGDFYNISVHGLSKFTIEATSADLDDREVYVEIKVKRLVILGYCIIDSIIGLKTSGPFNITLLNVTGGSTVFLNVDQDGNLFANKSISGITYESLDLASSAQIMISGAGAAILAVLKPDILNEIDEHVTKEVNASLKGTPKMPCRGKVSPIDLAIFEGRKFVAERYEPFDIDKVFEHDSEFLAVRVGPLKIRGLSRFSRVGKVTLSTVNRTVQIGARIVTGRLLGRCLFFYDFGKVNASRTGVANFTIERLQIEMKFNQSVDVCRRPVLDDLQLEMGRVAVSLDGKGMIWDYLVELAAQYLPQMLRYAIIDVLEEPIKETIQSKVLDRLDMNEIRSALPLLQSVCSS